MDISSTEELILSGCFFIRPFLILDNSFKEEYWKKILYNYQISSDYQNLPFSFSEYLNLPLFMIDQVNINQRDIVEKKNESIKKATEK